jgi:4-amino-4-deoxy-L-arabinose transferase-like glycosyltransferase
VTVALIAFYEMIGEFRGPISDAQPGPQSGLRHGVLRMRLDAWQWSAVAWGATALAVLTKGPIGLALPLMVVVPYALWRRAGRALREPVGPLLFVALVLPWVMTMSRRVPQFLTYAIGTETFARLLTPALGRTAPWWYFAPILLVGAVPWSVVVLAELPRAWVARRREGKTAAHTMFLILWIVVPLIFFSLSQSKRPQYVLPLIPAVALLAADIMTSRERLIAVRAAGAALVFIGICLAAAPHVLPHLAPISPDIQTAMRPASIALALVTMISGVLVAVIGRRSQAVLTLLALPAATIPVVGMGLMRAVGRERSGVVLANAIAAAAPSGVGVIAIHTFPLSLPFHLRHQVLLSTGTAAELTSNYLVRDIERWREQPGSPLRPADWWLEAAATCGSPRVFVTRAGDTAVRAVLANKLPLLVETAKYAAYGPCVRSDLAWEPAWPVVGHPSSAIGVARLRRPSTERLWQVF